MIAFSLILTAVLAAGPDVSVLPLSGEPQSGALTGLTAEAVQFETAEGSQSLEVNALRSLSFTAVSAPDAFADPPAIEVWLTDGSRFACRGMTSQLDTFTLDGEDLGQVTSPRTAIRAVRLGSEDRLLPRWDELRERDNAADMLVVAREQSLDFIEGAVGDIGETEISFLLQDQTRSLPRSRAFGIVFAAPKGEAVRPAMRLHVGRSALQLAALSLAESTATAALAAGPKLELPVALLRLIEFAGRVRYLGELTPVVELPPDASEDEKYRFFRRGTEPFGAPLRIGADEVITEEGLWMHSGVTARYRINRDYRRLAAVVGMDHNVGGNRSVRLVISGDGKPLFDDVIQWSEPALDLDLDVTGVRDLELRVERLPEAVQSNIFGIQEHLDLGDIRLVR